MWDLPRPRLEPVSPALAGRFSTTAPGKPNHTVFTLMLSWGLWALKPLEFSVPKFTQKDPVDSTSWFFLLEFCLPREESLCAEQCQEEGSGVARWENGHNPDNHIWAPESSWPSQIKRFPFCLRGCESGCCPSAFREPWERRMRRKLK